MTEKLLFLGQHYFALLLFVVACWGFGQLAIGRMLRSADADPWLGHALAICVGMGIFILALQFLGATRQLHKPWIYALLAGGGVAGALHLRLASRVPEPPSNEPHARTRLNVHWTAWLVMALMVNMAVDPLRPPLMWDELAYHLPHAQQWAQSGSLRISEWLRFPWFPFNYNLLYAGALELMDDVLPHLLHALAGWLTALLIYQAGKRYSTRSVACLGSIIWLFLSRNEYTTAYIDMGVTLFVLASCIAFQLWLEKTDSRAWLAVAAFLMGVAVGSKYQALGFLPLFAVALLARDRRLSTLATAAGYLALPCIYWYARNAILTGDPFNPFGGKFFGFSDWNLGDYEYAFFDLRKASGWPSAWLWAATLAPFIAAVRRRPAAAGAIVFCVYAFLVWAFTARLPRYLMPAYPLLALLAASVYCWIISKLVDLVRTKLLPQTWAPGTGDVLRGAVGMLVFIVISNFTINTLSRHWTLVATNPQERRAILHRELGEYAETLEYLNSIPGARIYQNGMEGAIYYAPHPIWGDHFGPYRYRDFVSGSPATLAKKLQDLNLNTLVLRIAFSSHLMLNDEFHKYFVELHASPHFKVYRTIGNTAP